MNTADLFREVRNSNITVKHEGLTKTVVSVVRGPYDHDFQTVTVFVTLKKLNGHTEELEVFPETEWAVVDKEPKAL